MKVTISPSGLATAVACPRQWFNVYVKGKRSIPSVRAFIGNGIHKAAEVTWNECIIRQSKVFNMTTLNDASIEEFNKKVKGTERLEYDDIKNNNEAEKLILKGNKTFISDIFPENDIPTVVEKYMEVPVNNAVVSKIAGTADYINANTKTLADIKTSKKAITPLLATRYRLQQSVYSYLSRKNGTPIETTLIQGIKLADKSTGSTVEIPKNEQQIVYIINNILKRLTEWAKGGDPDLLFPGNPEYMLCSNKWCAFYTECPYTGETLK